MNKNLEKCIQDISNALNMSNWNRFKLNAHNLKASAGYTGAGLIHYDCFYIQNSFVEKDYIGMAKRYNKLIEDSI